MKNGNIELMLYMCVRVNMYLKPQRYHKVSNKIIFTVIKRMIVIQLLLHHPWNHHSLTRFYNIQMIHLMLKIIVINFSCNIFFRWFVCSCYKLYDEKAHFHFTLFLIVVCFKIHCTKQQQQQNLEAKVQLM